MLLRVAAALRCAGGCAVFGPMWGVACDCEAPRVPDCVLAAWAAAIKPQLAQFCACRHGKALLTAPPLRQTPHWFRFLSAPVSGRSSGVEHNLAKVGVEGSNPFARSIFFYENEHVKRSAKARNLLPRPVRRAGGAGGKHNSAFRGVVWHPHCGILDLAIPRRKGHRDAGKDRRDCIAEAKIVCGISNAPRTCARLRRLR